LPAITLLMSAPVGVGVFFGSAAVAMIWPLWQ
jgi:hypothetical protein